MQRIFFPSLKGIQYCDCRKDYHTFLDLLLHTDEFDFDPQQALKSFRLSGSLKKNVPTVFSDEMFYAPLQWSRYLNRTRGCYRLPKLFPGSQVSIVLRNQRSLLSSLYRMYIKTGGTSSWLNFLNRNISEGYLHYDSYIFELKNRFGSDNVAVFLYEDFVHTPESYLNSWCEWLGVDVLGWNRIILNHNENPSISPGLLPLLRVANRFFSSRRHSDLFLPSLFHGALGKILLIFSKPIKGTNYNLCPDTEKLTNLLEDCRKGNRRISTLLNRDLTKLNYPC